MRFLDKPVSDKSDVTELLWYGTIVINRPIENIHIYPEGC